MFTESFTLVSDSDDSETDGEEYTVINSEAGGTFIKAAHLRNIQIGSGRVTIVTDGKSRRKQEPRPKPKQPEHHTFAPKVELTDSISQPSTSDLNHICNNTGKSWKKLGRALGISKATIEMIEMDYHVEGVYEMAWQTILRWRRRKGNDAKLRDLAKALDEIGLKQLARQLPVG